METSGQERRDTVMSVAVDDPRASLLVVEVSAPDLAEPLTFVVIGCSGTVPLPQGRQRRVIVHVHDAEGFERCEGEAEVTVEDGDLSASAPVGLTFAALPGVAGNGAKATPTGEIRAVPLA